MKLISFGQLGFMRKVQLATLILSSILLLSAAIAYIEFSRMSEYVSTFIAKNVECINSSKELVDICESYNKRLLDNEFLEESTIAPIDSQVTNFVNLVSSNTTVDAENRYVDSIRYAYVAYMQVVNSSENMWFEDYSDRLDWYRNDVEKVYLKLKGYLLTLSSLSQNVLSSNYTQLSETYYRSITPSVLATAASVATIILFVYFLTIFLLNPVARIHKGLKDYRDFGRSYKVNIENGSEELMEINEMVKDMIDDLKR